MNLEVHSAASIGYSTLEVEHNLRMLTLKAFLLHESEHLCFGLVRIVLLLHGSLHQISGGQGQVYFTCVL